MGNNNIDKMKKIIEEKKKGTSQQGFKNETPNKKIGNNKKGFKNTKRGGALDK
ncbi:hypothetical protein AN1V17_42770 [Vallitalea sediminicola]